MVENKERINSVKQGEDQNRKVREISSVSIVQVWFRDMLQQ